MPDVVRIARDRRAELAADLDRLDEFIRTAEELISREEGRHARSAAEFFQARFNSGEVLPPAASPRRF